MLQTFDLTVEEFQLLTEKIEYADRFGEEYREYVIPFLFEDAYLVKLKDKFYKKPFYFDYGLGVFFERGIELMSGTELQGIIEEYAITMEKVKTIPETKSYYHALEKIKKEKRSCSYYGVIKKRK